MFQIDTCINLEKKKSMSKFSPFFLQKLCHSAMHVAYLQEQLGGQRPSEVGTHSEESPSSLPGCKFLSFMMEIQPYITYKGFAEMMALGLVSRCLLI